MNTAKDKGIFQTTNLSIAYFRQFEHVILSAVLPVYNYFHIILFLRVSDGSKNL